MFSGLFDGPSVSESVRPENIISQKPIKGILPTGNLNHKRVGFIDVLVRFCSQKVTQRSRSYPQMARTNG